MTIEEKMEHFKSISLENASGQSHTILSAYKKSLEEQFEKHKEEALRDAKQDEDKQIAVIKRDAKREFSKAQTELRHTVTRRRHEIKEEIFRQVEQKLSQYKETEEYPRFLLNSIRSLLDVYGEDGVIFYIDSTDADLLDSLRSESGAGISVSDIAFGGGIVAVIASRNLLIDQSFRTRMAEERENFTISY